MFIVSLVGTNRCRRFFVVALLSLLLTGCALPALNLITPHSGYERTADIAYGDKPRQMLDLYHPDEALQGAPTLIFFYGGSWQEGYKGGYRFVAQALSEAGYRVVVPDYRLYPQVRFPVFIEDGAAAVQWAVNAGLATDGLVLMGHSAGAHTAAMLALDERFLDNAGVSRELIRAWVGLSGPYDFLPLSDPDLIDIFGGATGVPHTQPITFVSADDPPALLIDGLDDTIVRPRNLPNLAGAYRQIGVEVETHRYEGVNHNDTVASFSVRLRDRSPGFEDTLSFLQRLQK
ncbi:alpha/beta hydrolase [Saccharospirillum impatiens]|uniref:alpha/beta hydrolase n=1 Tax=Saccharospirillum impatiens TaxID=169438 RepID=UPI0004238B46|nr:alpha/beta hydrolase [Saccharospirillum impatiens]